MQANNLAGKRIVVTRATNQADELDDLLRRRGAEPLPYPCIAIAPPEDTGPLDAALRGLAAGEFDWLVLTSQNTVTALAERLKALELEIRKDDLHPDRERGSAPSPPWGEGWGEGRVSVAAIGTATAEAAARELGLHTDLAPAEFVAEALAAALAERLKPGSRVLLCQADIARPVLVEELTAARAAVTSVVAYRTVIGSGGVDLKALLAARQVDAVTFTSSSTVRNLFARLAAGGGNPADLVDVCVACLGPVTARTARSLGLTVHVMPEEHTIPALVDALDAHFAR